MSRFPVLGVCTANICRSALMELLFSSQLDDEHFEVASAGIRGFERRPMDSMSAMEALRLGLDPFAFRSQHIAPTMVERSGLILTATRDHRSWVLDENPGALRRCFTLLEFANLAETLTAAESVPHLVELAAKNRASADGAQDIDDPFGRSPDVHRATADSISDAVTRIATRLNVLSS